MTTRPAPIVVIVVEDEPLIRSIVLATFEDAGFVALEAADAADAIRILQLEADHVDALFTDVNMPGQMNGVMLAKHIRQNWPWIGLLIASGQVIPEVGDLPEDSRFFRKPYDLKMVVTGLRETIRRAH